MLRFIVVLFCAISLCAEDFVVGTSGGYAPFCCLNNEGHLEGFDMDVATRVAQKLGRTLVVKDLGSMASLLVALEQGQIDCIIWAMSITKSRQEKMIMVHYQGEGVTSLPVLFWEKIPDGAATLDEVMALPGPIAVEAGSFQEQVVSGYPEEKLRRVTSLGDALLEVRFGRAKAALMDPALLPTITARQPQIRVLQVPLAEKDWEFGSGIAFRKSDRELALQVRAAIEELKAEGAMAALEAKWLK